MNSVFYASKSGNPFGILGVMDYTRTQTTLLCKEMFWAEDDDKLSLYMDVASCSGVETKEKEKVESGKMILFLQKKDSSYTTRTGETREKLQSRYERALIHILKGSTEPNKVYECQIVIADSSHCDGIITGQSYSGKKHSEEMMLAMQEDIILILSTPEKPTLNPENDIKQSSNNGRKSYSSKTQLQLAEERIDAIFKLVSMAPELSTLLSGDDELTLAHLLPGNLVDRIPDPRSRQYVASNLAVILLIAGIQVSIEEYTHSSM